MTRKSWKSCYRRTASIDACRETGRLKETGIPLILAAAGLFPFVKLLGTANSLLYPLIGAGLFLLFQSSSECSLEKSERVAAIALGIWFSLMLLLGFDLDHQDRLEILHPESFGAFALELVAIVGGAFDFSAVLRLLYSRVRLQPQVEPEVSSEKRCKTFFTYAGIVFLFWTPYLIAYFPSCMTHDSFSELTKQLTQQNLSNHHPYLHQLLIRLFCETGIWLGSLTFGAFLYTLFQMVFLASAFSYSACCLLSAGFRRRTVLTVVLLCGAFSVNGFYSVSMWKDIPFAAATLIFCSLMMEEALKPGERSAGRTLRMILFGFLFCTLRNNGFYAFLLGFPFCLVTWRAGRSRMIICYAASVLLCMAYLWALPNIWGIPKSETREMLSVPAQQIARTIRDNPDVVLEEDWTDLDDLFDHAEGLGERYDPRLADATKGGLDTLGFDENPKRAVSLWIRLGLRSPSTYLMAFLMQGYGYWYPDVSYWIIAPQIDANEFGMHQIQSLKGIRTVLESIHYWISGRTPLQILYRTGIYFWILLLSVSVLLLAGKRREAACSGILFALWLTNLASPVYAEFRYNYAMAVCIPLFAVMALGCLQSPFAINGTIGMVEKDEHC